MFDSHADVCMSDTSIACESVATTGVHNPVCGVSDYVMFYKGVCPYSGCHTCKECAPTRLEEKLLLLLTSSDIFWQA